MTIVKSSSSGHRLLYLYISHLAKAFIKHSKCFCHFATFSFSSILSKKSSLSSISISRISGKVQSSRLPLYGQSLNTFNSLSSRSLVVIRNRVSQLVIPCQNNNRSQFVLITYIIRMKKANPRKRDLPYLKTISQPLSLLSECK